VAGPIETDTGRRRATGFRDAARALGLAEGTTPVVEESFSEQGGYASVARLLALPESPTAVVFASLAAAIGGIAGITAAGLSVPEDVSIVGFHDAPIAAYLNPPLTTVRMALREMAEKAVDLLVRQIAGIQVGSVVVTTEPVLVERSSTQALQPARRRI
jgi:LacI family transcriptional regulator